MVRITYTESVLHVLVYVQRERDSLHPDRLHHNGLEEVQDVGTIHCGGICILARRSLPVFRLVCRIISLSLLVSPLAS